MELCHAITEVRGGGFRKSTKEKEMLSAREGHGSPRRVHEVAKAITPLMTATNGTVNSQPSEISVFSYKNKTSSLPPARTSAQSPRMSDIHGSFFLKGNKTSSLPSTSHSFRESGCHPSDNSWTMKANFVSTILRREQAVMDPETHMRLCLERQFRRYDPAHGFERRKQNYVYYNHRSKGCSIPSEHSKKSLTLTYNHMFDFSDGSRFLSEDVGSARPNPSVIDPLTGTFKSATISCCKPVKRPKFHVDAGATHHPENRQTVSVDVACSLKISDLRPNPFQKKVIIEDVIASNRHCMEKAREGISSVLGKGKVKWDEVPERLRGAFGEEQTRYTASLDSARAIGMESKNNMGETQHSRYQAASSYASIGSVTNGTEQHQLERGHEREVFWADKTLDRPVGRQHVVFTDHAIQVVMGFTEHVSPSVVSGNDLTSHYYERMPEEHVEKSCGKSEENGPSDHIPVEQQNEQEVVENREKSSDPLPPVSQLAAKQDILLPPVAVAQIREAEWFDTTVSRKSYASLDKLMGNMWMPEKPLPFETSRLRYIRDFDVGDGKPPSKKVHWWAGKTLQ